MVVTVTLNPAMDRTLEVPDFEVGQHRRARLVALVPAGKGVNVARGLARLGAPAVACVLVGQAEEALYRESLEVVGLQCALCPVSGSTRTSTTVLDPVRHTTTHLTEAGFTVGAADLARLRAALRGVIVRHRDDPAGVVVAFCGGLPTGLGLGDWISLLAVSREAGATVVVDTSGEALRAAVKSGAVSAIKPNLLELGECLGEQVQLKEAPARAAELLDQVETVLLTLGAQGAYAVRRDGSVGMACRIQPAQVRNTVGCGDAFLAGWLYGWSRSGDVGDALRWAVATGAASACRETTVGYTREEVEQLLSCCQRI